MSLRLINGYYSQISERDQEPKHKAVTVRISSEQADFLKDLSFIERILQSKLLREAIASYLVRRKTDSSFRLSYKKIREFKNYI